MNDMQIEKFSRINARNVQMMIAKLEFFIENIQILLEKIYQTTVTNNNNEKCYTTLIGGNNNKNKQQHRKRSIKYDYHTYHYYHQEWIMSNHYHLGQSIVITHYNRKRRRQQQITNHIKSIRPNHFTTIKQQIWQWSLLMLMLFVSLEITIINVNGQQQQQQQQAYHVPFANLQSLSSLVIGMQQQQPTFNIHHYPSSYLAPSVAKIDSVNIDLFNEPKHDLI
ncbi:hypothetical protein DERP_005018 [Dermatophagoides pteronyssinus]|uniref:Uncharacterized protein n=1 Tax=Dermatophagoides pteronyssinus TaxID=6956 RepID=A0ABQ8JTQ6_DERPT|nr:hypothetical protein DERP_005018 [Dermatophagoides pteronyssinus]